MFNEALEKLWTVYLDDILIFSTRPIEHLYQIEWVSNKLQEQSLYTKATIYKLELT